MKLRTVSEFNSVQAEAKISSTIEPVEWCSDTTKEKGCFFILSFFPTALQTYPSMTLANTFMSL